MGGTCENNERLKGFIEDLTRGDVCTQFGFLPTAPPENKDKNKRCEINCDHLLISLVRRPRKEVES